MSTTTNKKRRSWEHEERRYHCLYCNVWLGSDRPSILLHENGKKHKENVETYMQNKRKDKLEKEKAASLVQKSLAQMESAARQAHANDLPYYHHVDDPIAAGVASPPAVLSIPAAAATTTNFAAATTNINTLAPNSSSMQEWQDRKKQREDDKKKKRGDKDEEQQQLEEEEEARPHQFKRIKIEPNQGHYSSSSDGEEKTWLEGVVFGDLLEADMPVQLWTGPLLSGATERRLVERDLYWKDALIVAVRHNNHNQLQQEHADRIKMDVAFLESPDDTQETMVKSVPLDRIRLLLGNPNDDRIPETLEEARLLAMGGEEVVAEEQHEQLGNQGVQETMIDETTGFSSWTTVSVKKTTVRQELKEERARMRQKRVEAAGEAERQVKLAEERKMEEAKVANADDSALGAYDVWSRGTKEGYKGVDIHGELKVEVHELGKKLAEGKAVSFKKPAFNAKNKKQNRRTTSADD